MNRGSMAGIMILAQSPQPMVMPTLFWIMSTASRFGARAVRNMELVTQVALMPTQCRYAPILRGSLSGVELNMGGMLLAMG